MVYNKDIGKTGVFRQFDGLKLQEVCDFEAQIFFQH
jgi:hypothetical protein